MGKRRNQMVRFYTQDDHSEWVWSKYIDARYPVEFIMHLDRLFVRASRRGIPWKCLLARAIMFAAQKDPSLFPHKVLFVYAIGSVVYIMIKRPEKSGEHYLSVRYRHNFTKTLRQFDMITKAQFLELFGDTGVEIRLTPIRKRTREHEKRDHGRGHVHREPQPEPRLTGAWRRARDAHLHIPGTRKQRPSKSTPPAASPST
jgi:hypothetical protein